MNNPKPVKAPEKRPFMVMRDYWPTDDQRDRVPKGTIIELTAENAIDGIQAGALTKAY